MKRKRELTEEEVNERREGENAPHARRDRPWYEVMHGSIGSF